MNPLLASSATGTPYLVCPHHTAYASVLPHRSTQNHYHNIYHIVFVFEGAGTLLNGTHRVHLEPGTVTCIDPGNAHVFTTGAKRLLYYAFNFYLLPWQHRAPDNAPLQPDELEQNAETVPLHHLFGIPEQDGALAYDARDRNGILNLVRNFDAQNEAYVTARYAGEDTAAHAAWYRFHAFTFLHTLLFTYLVPRGRTTGTPETMSDPLLSKAVAYLEANVTRTFSLAGMARATGKNPGYVSGYFSRRTGTTANAYFNRLKVKRACVLLKTTRKSITDIALELGYGSSQHFSMRFKEIKRMSPKKFRDAVENY